MFSNEDEINIPIDSAKNNQMNNNNCKTVNNIPKSKPNILLKIGIPAKAFTLVVVVIIVIIVIINQKGVEKKNDNNEEETDNKISKIFYGRN